MVGGPPSPALYRNGKGVGARHPKFAAATNPSHILIQSREARGRRDVPPAPPRRSPPPLPSPVSAGGGQRASATHVDHHCRRTHTSTTPSSSASSVPWPPPPLHHLPPMVCVFSPLSPSLSLSVVVDQGTTLVILLRMYPMPDLYLEYEIRSEIRKK